MFVSCVWRRHRHIQASLWWALSRCRLVLSMWEVRDYNHRVSAPSNGPRNAAQLLGDTSSLGSHASAPVHIPSQELSQWKLQASQHSRVVMPTQPMHNNSHSLLISCYVDHAVVGPILS